MKRDIRKPLVVFTPKSLLRAKASRSPVDAFLSGSFEEVLDDAGVADPAAVTRVVFASGKVAAEAQAAREKRGGAPVAICRVEQLYPWPYEGVAAILAKYANAREIFWLQEEPENMGAWNFIKGRLYEAHDDTHSITRVSRTESGSPATGTKRVHDLEQEELFDKIL
jgi:2-oxoglutarate dehydrogenase E1 component